MSLSESEELFLKSENALTFADLNLAPPILKAVEESGYTIPTPIQLEAIPRVMQGQDLLASAQTGTGKTASFMLPSLHRMHVNPRLGHSGPRMLVLVPTRELAMQVDQETKKYSKHFRKMKSVCIYGGVSYQIQNRALGSPYEILIATPGRLIDQLERGKIDLSNLEILVLDEADRMLDMGFIKPVHDIADQTPETRQTLLFSATVSRNIIQLSNKLLKNPHRVEIKANLSSSGQIDQCLHYVDDMDHKVKVLEHLLEETSFEQAIIFTGTKRCADRLADNLVNDGYKAEALHGDMNQRQRAKTIDKLRKGELKILVATDVAARGIDVTTISHVFNFDLPMQPEDYIHRIGRTGRAGATGVAITFSTFRESSFISQIEKLIGQQLVTKIIPGLEPTSRKSSSGDKKGGFPPRGRGRSSSFGGNKSGSFGGSKSGSFGGNKSGSFGGNKSSSFGGNRSEGSSYGNRSEGSSYGKRSEGSSYGNRSEGSSYGNRSEGSSYGNRSEGSSYGNRSEGSSYGNKSGSSYGGKSGSSYGNKSGSSYGSKSGSSFGGKSGGSSFGGKSGGSSFGSKKKFVTPGPKADRNDSW